ncbi:hypothetical protein ACPPVO_25345 [Dactylosporangium sp. McL0621]|uniref:hypothetical protein n=1 Tax=Dactylosporangium sp. McL0621 TaxID=3415678 RepID=UPI003CF74B14
MRRRTRLWLALLLAPAALLAVPVGVATASPPRDKYLGRWNYDQPDPATGNNIAVLACPDGGVACNHNPDLPLPLSIPQVGWIDFTPGPRGTVYGHTDQGCTWNFSVSGVGLELSSPTQLCFNATIGQYYSIKQWSVQVDGDAEREQIVSQSIQPNGDILYTTMNFGTKGRPSRHRATGAPVNRFTGSFTHDPFSFRTLTNVTVTDKGGAAQETGVVRIERAGGDRIVARTPDGCRWALRVQGNTAELLDPATQSCQVGENTRSLRYWALVTDDGRHLSGFRSGYTFAQGLTNEYTFINALSRS